MQLDSTTLSLFLGAVITVLGVILGIKGITIKNHAKTFAADCAIFCKLWAEQDETPTPAQIDTMWAAEQRVIADALVLGQDFAVLFDPAEVAAKRKMVLLALKRG